MHRIVTLKSITLKWMYQTVNHDHNNSLDINESDLDVTLLHIWCIKSQLDESMETLEISKQNMKKVRHFMEKLYPK